MSKSPATTDVAIVGAGPLAYAGLRVGARRYRSRTARRCRSKADESRRRSCTLAPSKRSNLGVADELLAIGVKVPQFSVRDPDRALLTVSRCGTRASPPHRFAATVPAFERLAHESREPHPI